MAGAEPLSPDSFMLPKSVRDILIKARVQWLRNTEVQDLLQHHQKYGLKISREPPTCPPSGQLFLFNRRCIRFFRKDGHVWKKKADGKTVKEVHEKLKIGSRDALNCYYAHAENGLQRRCYWMLEGNDAIVLVHYLDVGQAGNLTRCATYPGASPPTGHPGDAVGSSAFAAAAMGLLSNSDLSRALMGNQLLSGATSGSALGGSNATSLLSQLQQVQQLQQLAGAGPAALAAAQVAASAGAPATQTSVGSGADLSPGASSALLRQLSQFVSAFSSQQVQDAAHGTNAGSVPGASTATAGGSISALRAGSGPMASINQQSSQAAILNAARSESAPATAGSLGALLAQQQATLQSNLQAAGMQSFVATQASGSAFGGGTTDRLGSGTGAAVGGLMGAAGSAAGGLLGLDTAGSGAASAPGSALGQQLADRLNSGSATLLQQYAQLTGQLPRQPQQQSPARVTGAGVALGTQLPDSTQAGLGGAAGAALGGSSALGGSVNLGGLALDSDLLQTLQQLAGPAGAQLLSTVSSGAAAQQQAQQAAAQQAAQQQQQQAAAAAAASQQQQQQSLLLGSSASGATNAVDQGQINAAEQALADLLQQQAAQQQQQAQHKPVDATQLNPATLVAQQQQQQAGIGVNLGAYPTNQTASGPLLRELSRHLMPSLDGASVDIFANTDIDDLVRNTATANGGSTAATLSRAGQS